VTKYSGETFPGETNFHQVVRRRLRHLQLRVSFRIVTEFPFHPGVHRDTCIEYDKEHVRIVSVRLHPSKACIIFQKAAAIKP
jgi:hypothetical protein